MRDAFLRFIARWSHDHYRLVLLLASLLTALSLVAATQLRFTSQVADLLPPSSPAVQEYQRAMETYGSMDYLIVVMENRQGEDIEL